MGLASRVYNLSSYEQHGKIDHNADDSSMNNAISNILKSIWQNSELEMAVSFLQLELFPDRQEDLRSFKD